MSHRGSPREDLDKGKSTWSVVWSRTWAETRQRFSQWWDKSNAKVDSFYYLDSPSSSAPPQLVLIHVIHNINSSLPRPPLFAHYIFFLFLCFCSPSFSLYSFLFFSFLLCTCVSTPYFLHVYVLHTFSTCMYSILPTCVCTLYFLHVYVSICMYPYFQQPNTITSSMEIPFLPHSQ